MKKSYKIISFFWIPFRKLKQTPSYSLRSVNTFFRPIMLKILIIKKLRTIPMWLKFNFKIGMVKDLLKK